MYHIIVADDMPMQLHMLESMTALLRPKWHIHAARDGQEVARLLKENKIDFIISDIRMPEMNGLDMLKEVKHLSPDALVVFVSGYALFEYAQSAIKLGAVDYLIKPVDINTLSDLLGRLEEMRLKRLDVSDSAKAMVLNQWLYTPLDRLEYRDYHMIHQLVGEDGYIGAVYHPSDPVRYTPELVYTLKTCLSRDYSVLFLPPLEERRILLMVISGKEGGQSGQFFSLIKTLAGQTGTSIGLSTFGRDLVDNGYEMRLMAFSALNDAFYEDATVKISSVKIKKIPIRFPSFQEIQRWVRISPEELQLKLEEALDSICKDRPQFWDVMQTMVFVMAELNEMEEDPVLQETTGSILRSFAEGMRRTTSYSMMHDHMLEAARKLGSAITDRAENADQPVRRCIQYLNKHYAEPISMEEMARKLFLTPNYFSALFKRQTGRRFVEYLTELRMEKAEKRIRTTHDFIYTIAKECGYSDEHYFNRIFNKLYGSSPAQYRRMHAKMRDPR